MNIISLQEVNDLITKCKMNLTDIDYCNEKDNLTDDWCNPDLKTIEDVMDSYGIEECYINPKYNDNRPSLDSITLLMDSGNTYDIDESTTDYFVVKIVLKDNENEIVAIYYVCD